MCVYIIHREYIIYIIVLIVYYPAKPVSIPIGIQYLVLVFLLDVILLDVIGPCAFQA